VVVILTVHVHVHARFVQVAAIELSVYEREAGQVHRVSRHSYILA